MAAFMYLHHYVFIASACLFTLHSCGCTPVNNDGTGTVFFGLHTCQWWWNRDCVLWLAHLSVMMEQGLCSLGCTPVSDDGAGTMLFGLLSVGIVCWAVSCIQMWHSVHGLLLLYIMNIYNLLLCLLGFADVEPMMFRRSDSVDVSMVGSFCRIRLPAAARGIHLLQYLSPLTPNSSYFCCLIRRLSQ